jgi:hypothetical protein
MSKRILLAIVLLGSTLAMAQTASISGVVTDRVEVNKRGFAGVGHRLGAVQNAMLVRC